MDDSYIGDDDDDDGDIDDDDEGPIIAELAPDEEELVQQVQAQVEEGIERERRDQIIVEAKEVEDENPQKTDDSIRIRIHFDYRTDRHCHICNCPER